MAETQTEVAVVQVRYYCEHQVDDTVCGQEMFPNANYQGSGPDRLHQHECSRGHREYLAQRYPTLRGVPVAL